MRSEIPTISGSLGTTKEWQKEAVLWSFFALQILQVILCHFSIQFSFFLNNLKLQNAEKQNPIKDHKEIFVQDWGNLRVVKHTQNLKGDKSIRPTIPTSNVSICKSYVDQIYLALSADKKMIKHDGMT